MFRKNIFLRFVGYVARKYRGFQEAWILPLWKCRRLTEVPFWTLDVLILVVKICSSCVVSVVKVFIPPVVKSLHGETVLITGAGHGIGRELAIQLAELGATIVCWDSDSRQNDAVVQEIRKKDGECFGFTIDITAREQVTTLASRVRQLTDVSMVISNAGTFVCEPLIHLRPEGVAKLLEVNLLAHFWIIQAFLPSMIARRQGHIVAINSSAGLIPWPNAVPYCAAKFGLKGLMDSLAEELRMSSWTKNVYTTSVYLATVSTGLYPTPTHRFTKLYCEITAKDAAKIIIDGIRRNKKDISIPLFMNFLVQMHNITPHRMRIIFMDFFNYRHRAWFYFC